MIRVGQGVDIHPFDDSRPLVLGGVRIPDAPGLQGHSDADAVLHALTDALLGSVSAGDIGTYFPSTDEKWRHAGSSAFVNHALDILRRRNAVVSNVDITVIAQKPKLAPFREQMERSVAGILQVPGSAVSVKFTTTDHLGFVGREEGICVIAIVAVNLEG
jgi:2-C-methyl-D-erythritol 2,4-cyclodiphosphate synthase